MASNHRREPGMRCVIGNSNHNRFGELYVGHVCRTTTNSIAETKSWMTCTKIVCFLGNIENSICPDRAPFCICMETGRNPYGL